MAGSKGLTPAEYWLRGIINPNPTGVISCVIQALSLLQMMTDDFSFLYLSTGAGGFKKCLTRRLM